MLRRSLTTLSLVFILYFSTSGGAFTTETLVHEVGPGLALLILLLVPLVYSIPEVLIVGELASMLPVEGGYYRWVQRAFGPFWAFQNGWLTWMYSLVDMAIYPCCSTSTWRTSSPGCAAARLGRRAARHLGRDGDQPRRRGAAWGELGVRRRVHHRSAFVAAGGRGARRMRRTSRGVRSPRPGRRG